MPLAAVTWSNPAPMPSTMPGQDNSMASLSRLALARLGRGAVLTPDTRSVWEARHMHDDTRALDKAGGIGRNPPEASKRLYGPHSASGRRFRGLRR